MVESSLTANCSPTTRDRPSKQPVDSKMLSKLVFEDSNVKNMPPPPPAKRRFIVDGCVELVRDIDAGVELTIPYAYNLRVFVNKQLE
jgi:hypothetical protein